MSNTNLNDMDARLSETRDSQAKSTRQERVIDPWEYPCYDAYNLPNKEYNNMDKIKSFFNTILYLLTFRAINNTLNFLVMLLTVFLIHYYGDTSIVLGLVVVVIGLGVSIWLENIYHRGKMTLGGKRYLG